MAKKKPGMDTITDAMANFFGDDALEWLDDEEEGAQKAAPAAPAAPAPPAAPAVPPATPPATRTPLPPSMAATVPPWPPPAAAPSPVETEPELGPEPLTGEELKVAPTTFDLEAPPGNVAGTDLAEDPIAAQAPQDTVGGFMERVDDTPPPPAPTMLPEGFDDDLTTEAAAPRPLFQLHAPEASTLDVDPTTELVSDAEASLAEPPEPDLDTEAAEEPWPDEALAITGDELEASGQTPAPLVRTLEPVERDVTPPDDVPPALAFSPPPAWHEPARFVPRGDEERWRSVARALLSEAAVVPEQHGALFLAAARVYHRRLGDLDGARALFADAVHSGLDTEGLHRDRAAAAMDAGDWATAEKALLARASHVTGLVASEVLQDAAGMAAQHQVWADAVAHLRRAAELDPNDYIAVVLLRDQLAADDPQRAALLDRMASLSSGPFAAEARWEQGMLLQQQGRDAEAVAAFRAALAEAPGHLQAFLALERALGQAADHAGLAALYEAEAARTAAPESPWWWSLAAVAREAAGEVDAAGAAWVQAASSDDPWASRAREAWLASELRHEELEDALRAAVEAEPRERARAFALYRLARHLELDRDDPEGALDAYQQALDLDTAAQPAAMGVERLLKRLGRMGELLERTAALAAATTEPDRLPSLLLRVGELAELGGDLVQARAAFERLHAEVRPGWPVALDALQRVRAALGDAAGLRELYALRAESGDSSDMSAWLYLAAMAGLDPEPEGPGRALLEQALALTPDHPGVLETYGRLLARVGDHAALASTIRWAAESSELPADRARLHYRAARVLGDRLGDVDGALIEAGKALEADPDLDPARQLQREAASSSARSVALYELFKREAHGARDSRSRGWWMVAAADVAPSDEARRDDLLAVLQDAPTHPGALVAMEHLCLLHGDRSTLARVYRRAAVAETSPDRKSAILARLVWLLATTDDIDGVRAAIAQLTAHDAAIAWRGLAAVAAGRGLWSEAAELLARSPARSDGIERARIVGHRLKEPRVALERVLPLLPAPGADPADEAWKPVALLALQLASALGRSDVQLRVHELLARGASSDAFRAAHAAWAGDLAEELGQNERALAAHRVALALRPDSNTAFEAIRRLLVTTPPDDVSDQLRAHFATYRPQARRLLAEDLEAVGDVEGAVAAWTDVVAAADPVLPALYDLEHAQEQAGLWSAAYATLQWRGELTRSDATREEIEAKKRWVLAEKLAGTDEAWDLYRGLHAQNPNDREVIEALARIAGERGETALAIGYMQTLAGHADVSRADAARYQRRIGEIWERAGDAAKARQAWLDALDLVHDDAGSLAGLRRLAEATGDWSGLIAVLQRQAGVASGAGRTELLREVAALTEAHGEPAVAMDAWRAVLDADPADRVALERLVELSWTHEKWEAMVEHGLTLSELLEGPPRAQLLARLGAMAEARLDREQALALYEEAVAAEPPSVEAARRLAALYAQTNDWAGAVRCLVLVADTSPEVSEKVSALAEAGRIQGQELHLRDVAASLYLRVIELDGGHRRALSFLASWLYDQGRTAEAIPIYERLEPHAGEGLDLDDFDVRFELALFFFQLAEMLRQVGRVDDALHRYARVLELNPAHLPSLEAAAPLYGERQQWHQAEAAWRKIIQLIGGQGDKAQVAHAYVRLGHVEIELGHVDKASKRFAKALDLIPNHIGALKGMAVVYESHQDWDATMRAYNNMIHHARKPSDVIDAYMNKGRVLDVYMSRPDKAREHYERSLDVDPQQPVALLRLAELALREQKWKEAGGLAQRGLQVTADAGAIRADLLLVWALARHGTGDAEAAERALTEARATWPPLKHVLPEEPFADVDKVRRGIAERLPV